MDSRSRVGQKAEITRALMRLSAARREKLAEVDFEVFVEGLFEFPVADVVAVCADFGRITPEEFQPRFPPLYVLREACIKRQRIRQQRALPAAPVDELYPPLSDEKWAEIRAKFQEVMSRRSMPDTPSAAAAAGDRDE